MALLKKLAHGWSQLSTSKPSRGKKRLLVFKRTLAVSKQPETKNRIFFKTAPTGGRTMDLLVYVYFLSQAAP